jgi:hypothetical protein
MPAAANRRRKRPLLPRLIMAVAAVGLFVLGYQWGNQIQFGKDRAPAIEGVMIRPAVPLPDFVLTTTSGESFGRPDLADRWTLMAFTSLGGAGGHRSVARLIEVYNRLADGPDLQRRLSLTLISPDSAPALARDFERLSPAITILGGDAQEIRRLAQALGTDTPASTPQDLPPLFLITGANARLVALFPPAQSPARIAADVAALAEWPDLSADADNR